MARMMLVDDEPNILRSLDSCQASLRFLRDGSCFLSQAISFIFCGFKSTRTTRCQFRVLPDQRFGFLAFAA